MCGLTSFNSDFGRLWCSRFTLVADVASKVTCKRPFPASLVFGAIVTKGG
jgi:hypothetical protein